MDTPLSAAELQLNKLRAFRQAGYQALGRAHDALFELGDAVLLSPAIRSFVELSLSPVFRRRWASTYAALQDSQPDSARLLRLYAAQLPAPERPLLAGDHTAWPRPTAYTLAERTVEHQPSPVPGNRPITLGQGFSTIAWLPAAAPTWALPLVHERIVPSSSPLAQAADQLRRVTAVLPARPLSLWDSEYGCAPFVTATADIAADKIMRLRPNICLWGAPGPYAGRGAPRKHGAKFKLADPTSWGPPAEQLTSSDPALGSVTVQRWADLHFRKAPDQPLVVLRLERSAARGTRRCPRVVWLAWHGAAPPPLAEWWDQYGRRFALEHWYRLAKQRLHWTKPAVGTPAGAEHWSALIVLLSWQLWLARSVAADRPLPWQRAQGALTPGRVAAGLGAILAAIGTPARRPKRRGKAPGWVKGRPRRARERQAVVLKRGRKRQKKRKAAT
jgi:hypothetical protein